MCCIHVLLPYAGSMCYFYVLVSCAESMCEDIKCGQNSTLQVPIFLMRREEEEGQAAATVASTSKWSMTTRRNSTEMVERQELALTQLEGKEASSSAATVVES